MYEIVIGRSEKDKNKYGLKGTILLGKHYVRMGQVTSLSNPVLMDVTGSHVVFVCGKRGSGKSYTMGVIAEGMVNLPDEISSNISVIILDTMGIYWTMKYPNQQETASLREWDMVPKGLNVQIYTPAGYYREFKDKGIPTDFPFSVKPSELDAEDWCATFELPINEPVAVLIFAIIAQLKNSGKDFGIEDIIKALRDYEDTDRNIKAAAINRFTTAEGWGLFSKEGTSIKELINPGHATILDVSCYATTAGSNFIRALVIGLVAKKLFIERMVARRAEEYGSVHKSMSPFSQDDSETSKLPMVWLIIDEAHEFLPREGKTLASDPLITILREGRQPGISLVLATQQPGKIHTDVMTQSDTVISHRLTARLDVESLGMLMQSYMQHGLDKYLNELPSDKGSAIVFDDTNERLYPISVRPRLTWHGGGSPEAIKEKREF